MKITATALSLALLATGAAAQSFNGAEIGGSYSNFLDGSDNGFYALDASAEFGLGDFAVQLDASAFKWFPSPSQQYSATVHAIYKISDSLAVGAYAGIEDWQYSEGKNYRNLGVEAKYGLGSMPLTFEAYYYNTAAMDGSGDVYQYTGATATYDFASGLNMFAQYTNSSSSGSTYELAGVGVGYSLGGINISGQYLAYIDGSNQALVVRFSKSFGNGVTFSQRDWAAVTSGL